MKYVVEFFDPRNGATSPIDTIEEREGYTAEDYVRDCEWNSDDEWIELLHSGVVTLVEVEE